MKKFCEKMLKPSNIEWMGNVPKEWDIVKLKMHYIFEKGKNAALYTNEYIGQNEGEYPVYSGQTENDGIMGRVNTYDYDEEICIFTTTVGAKVMTPKILSGKFCLSQNCLIMKRIGEVEERFLFYQLLSLFEYEKSLIPTYMQPSLRISDLKKYNILYCEEQKSISKYLDTQCALIDKAIETQNKIIEKLKEYKKSIITEAVTKGLDKNAKMKDSGVEWIGKIPEGWEVKRTKFVITSFNKGNGITKEDVVEDGDISCVRYGEIYSKYNLKIYESLTTVNSNDIVNPIYISKGDLLFAGTGELIEEIGKNVVYLGDKSCLAGGDIIIMKHKQNPLFLSYLFNSEYCQSQKSYGKVKLKVVHISVNDIGNIFIAIPSLKEQQKIAEFLDKKCDYIDKVILNKEQIIDKLQNFKKSLIYECVTGKRKIS